MDYHFKPPGKACAATGQPLTPGTLCHSLLIETNGELQRVDYAAANWPGPPPEAYAHWETVVPLPANPAQIKLDPEALMRYFEQLHEEASPGTESTRYCLALLLLKQRKLRLEDARFDDEEEVLILTGTHGEGTFELRNLQLSEEESQRLQLAIRTHLATEWSGVESS